MVVAGCPQLAGLLAVLHGSSRFGGLEQRLDQMHGVEKSVLLAFDSAVFEEKLELRRGFAWVTAGHHIGKADPSHQTLPALADVVRDPDIGHRLRRRLTDLRSYRVGIYRIIYVLRDDKTVRVVAIRHRGDAYGTDPR